MGTQLPSEEKEELLGFLRKNIDVFAWNAFEAPRVDPDFICHYLNMNLMAVPKRQPSQRSFKEHAEVVKAEVNKLKRTGAIKEVFYPEWLANTVVVKKKSRKWRVCVEFTDLNMVYLKDHFSVLRIDQLVDAMVRQPRMSFLNAFQGNHQIPLALADQEKTALLTSTRNYHYRVMSFGLKNTGATYQRMVTRMFKPQLRKNVKAYINDMVIKSFHVSDHLDDLGSVFTMLKKRKLCLNASKCSFGVSSGKFLGYMITQRGIKVNPNHIKAINDLHPP